MSKFPVLDEICNVLETYKGRDKVKTIFCLLSSIFAFQFLRTICYSTKLISGLTSDPLLAKRMQNVSSQMSAARLILRLLDDLPMLKYAMEYGFGEEVNNTINLVLHLKS